MENWIDFSIDFTEIQYDANGDIVAIPRNYIAIMRQISLERFYVKDTSDNEGEFHYRQTIYKSVDSLLRYMLAFIEVQQINYGSDTYLYTEPVDFTVTGTYTIPIPTGFVFYCDEVGVIASAASTVTIQPEIKMGINSDDDAYLASGLTTGLTANNTRFKSDSAYINGETASINATVVTAATAAELRGSFYFKGFYMKNMAALP